MGEKKGSDPMTGGVFHELVKCLTKTSIIHLNSRWSTSQVIQLARLKEETADSQEPNHRSSETSKVGLVLNT